VNDATHHQGTYVAAWKTINELEGHEETCMNRKNGTVVWKVVPSHSITRDDFSEDREEEEASMATMNLPVADVENTLTKMTAVKDFGLYGLQISTKIFIN